MSLDAVQTCIIFYVIFLFQSNSKILCPQLCHFFHCDTENGVEYCYFSRYFLKVTVSSIVMTLYFTSCYVAAEELYLFQLYVRVCRSVVKD